MAVTTDPFTGTDLAGFIPEIWPGLINEALFAKAVAARFFTDLTPAARGGGDILHIPDVFTNLLGSTPGTADSQSTQGAEITTASPAQVDTTLTINTHSYLAWIIGDKDAAQILRGTYDYQKVYTDQAAGLLRKKLEADLFALWSGLSAGQVVGDTATVLSDAEIRVGIYTLENANFDTLEDCAFFFSPYTFFVQLGAVAKYYDQSQRGPSTQVGFTASGNLGEGMPSTGLRGYLYGIPTYISSNVVSGLQTYRNLLAHKSAFGFATQYLSTPGSSTQEEGRVRAQSSYELRNLGWLTVVDMIHGVAELRDSAAVVLNGSNVFIGS